MVSASPYHIDDPFLVDVMEALRERGDAFRAQGAASRVERVIEFRGESTVARIELLFRLGGSQMLSIHLWEDRAISLNAGESVRGGGWRFRYGSEGRFPGPNQGPELVRAAEASVQAMADTTDADPERLEAIWRPLIAKGPKLV